MSFDRFPDELLLAILRYLPAVDLAGGVQTANRRLNRLANDPKTWHLHCVTGFAYWNDSERALLRTAAINRSYNQPWKGIWLRRKRSDLVCAGHFEQILVSKVHRNYHMSTICSLQLDAKDFLHRQYRAADFQAFRELEAGDRGKPPPATAVTDCLARRYYANMAIGSINRSLAVEEWLCVRRQANQYTRLDRALAAFDMFSLIDVGADIENVAKILDRLAYSFVNEHRIQFPSMTVREKSYKLVGWLRKNNLVGMQNANERYRYIRNCLIGQALTDHPEHPSLPLISSAIFVCIAQRIGLLAYCVAIPGHVHATVVGMPGLSVDGRPLEAPAEGARQMPQQLPDNNSRIYFDPYRDSNELSLQQLRQGLDELAWNMAAPVQAGTVHGAVQVVDFVPAGADQPDHESASEASDDGTEDEGAETEDAATGEPTSIPVVSMVSNRDAFLMPTPTRAIVLRLTLNIEASWAFAMQVDPERSRLVKQLHRNIPVIRYTDPAQADTRHRCGSDGDPHADMEKMTYASAWAAMLMRATTSPEWEPYMDRLLSRFAHEFNEDAWIVEKYLLPIHDKYISDSVAANPQGRHALGQPIPIPFGDPAGRQRANAWTHVRNLLQMVYNVDRRPPLVSRRYTQDICERVRYKVGQVIRHSRFGFIGIIDGWTPEDPADLHGTVPMANDEAAPAPAPGHAANEGAAYGNDNGHAYGNAASPPANVRKSAFYSVMRTGTERRVVAQHNIEIVTDPRQIPPELMFLAGKHFKRFDYATCTFVSNLTEFFPDD
ncbi:f-box domain-containing protein [Ophiostoma piceae UAMH 11346]|uniref:F-box domain-containing protein n=1 Tax=Ophiostoma piceae (strain UAMH 11346) TaxID=1262450 RepID=S3CRT2_OPHP1|nr:f-box domain-containing protein [Ophiostoma piceae UAMH 11346]